MSEHRYSLLAALLCAAMSLAACGGGDDDAADSDTADTGDETPDAPDARDGYLLVSVVINPDNDRTTFVQVVPSLDAGPFTNESALEVPGNAIVMASGSDFFTGLADEPTWVRYTVDASGDIRETGRLSLLNYGASSIDFGNTIVDEQTAVSVLGQQAIAVVWNPQTMEITGEVALDHLPQEGYQTEVWTTTSHDGRVYIPGRGSDWIGLRIRPAVSLTILDPYNLEIIGVAEDDRCASGGRPLFDSDGYAYVMGDGRNFSIHAFAFVAGGTAPDNCLLRIAPGETDFEEDFYASIPDMTGGLQSITELETGNVTSGLGFAKMFYPDRLPPDVDLTSFDFWNELAHKMWRIELGDTPTAVEVEGIPFSTIGFAGSEIDGKLYTGDNQGGDASEVYEIDPATNTATRRFEMDGAIRGLYKLSR